MKLREFSRSFFSLAVKPRKNEWNLKVIERGKEVLSLAPIGTEIYAPTGTFDRDVVKWWIDHKTICVVVE